MPIYEYQCAGCGQEFTAIRRITDDTLPPCPACQSANVQKKISLSAFHLKGSGWYKTDYAKSGTGDNGKGLKKATEPASSEASAPSSDAAKPATPSPAPASPSAPSPDKKPSST